MGEADMPQGYIQIVRRKGRVLKKVLFREREL